MDLNIRERRRGRGDYASKNPLWTKQPEDTGRRSRRSWLGAAVGSAQIYGALVEWNETVPQSCCKRNQNVAQLDPTLAARSLLAAALTLASARTRVRDDTLSVPAAVDQHRRGWERRWGNSLVLDVRGREEVGRLLLVGRHSRCLLRRRLVRSDVVNRAS